MNQAHTESALNETFHFGWITVVQLSLCGETYYFSLSPKHLAGTEVALWLNIRFFLAFVWKGSLDEGMPEIVGMKKSL